MNQSPQELLSHLMGVLETTQQQGTQARAGNEAVTQALTVAVQELTVAVRALTAMVESLKLLLMPKTVKDPTVLTIVRPGTGS